MATREGSESCIEGWRCECNQLACLAGMFTVIYITLLKYKDQYLAKDYEV
jgi:hypothetical protein